MSYDNQFAFIRTSNLKAADPLVELNLNRRLNILNSW